MVKYYDCDQCSNRYSTRQSRWRHKCNDHTISNNVRPESNTVISHVPKTSKLSLNKSENIDAVDEDSPAAKKFKIANFLDKIINNKVTSPSKPSLEPIKTPTTLKKKVKY